MKKFLIIVLAFLLISSLSLYMYLQNKTSVRSGQLDLQGLQQQVSVDYDQWGIPHIRAKNIQDALLALGFVHAQDRLFQMDLLRRVGHGRLAELMGKPVVRVDKLFRTLGTHQYAQQQAEKTRKENPQIAELMQAYYQGVNQAIEQLSLPLEYVILGVEPKPFGLEDGFAIASYMAHSFAAGLTADPVMTAIQQKVSAEHLAELEWGWPLDQVSGEQSLVLAVEDLLAISDQSEALLSKLPFGTVHGSNAWAISSKKTANGNTLYANDPHMSFSVPAVWYEAQLTTPDTNVYGHFAAGVPFPLLMRTEYRVHGLTMLQNDDADLYAMPVSEDESQVLYAGNWIDVTTRLERIQVKGGESVEFSVTSTPVGPLVNDVLEVQSNKAVTLDWLFTHPDNNVVKTFHDLFFANDLQSVEAAVSQHWAPGLNISYADADDNIAMWAAGRFFQRPAGVNGKTIIDASLAENIRLGLHDFSHNPRIINPHSGYLFSTNNPYPSSDPAFAHAGYYSPIQRALVAEHALSQESEWDLAKMQALQTSSENARWLSLKPFMQDVLTQTGLDNIEQTAKTLLLDWDGSYTEASAAASLFERLYYFVHQGVFQDELGRLLFTRFFNRPLADNSLYKLLQLEQATWWDDINTERQEARNDILLQAFHLAVRSLSDEFGEQPDNWQWQSNASLTHPHPLGRVNPLDTLFNVGTYSVLGSKRAINNLIFAVTDKQIKVTRGPSTRRIVDLQNPRMAKNINPVGQSGRVFDQHYRDQADRYHNNEYRNAIMFEERDAGVSQLTLQPQK